MNVHVFRADWRSHAVDVRFVRERVFVDEQGFAAEAEFDGRDDDAEHFLAKTEAGQPVGTARLLPTGQIGRVAVLAEHRRRGVGRRLLDAAVDAAAERGLRTVFLNAQLDAVSLYRAAGFAPVGDVFDEEGVPHQRMERLLPVAYPTPSVAGRPQSAIPPPPSSAPAKGMLVTFGEEGDCRAALDAVVASARRRLTILSPNLEPALFATQSMLTSVSEFARRAAVTHVQILVEDTRALAEDAHRLLELARRLPSKIEIRRLPDDDVEARPQSFAVADDEAYWVMPDRDAFVGYANRYDRVEARRLAEAFDRLFARSTDDPELRLLSW